MEISRKNYEHYFLDYIEGNLSSEQEDMLRNFLQFNPDLAEELKTFELQNMPLDHIVFPAKNKLKKHFPQEGELLDDQNFDMFSIAYLENDLTDIQRDAFDTYIQDKPAQEKDFKLLKKTVLTAKPYAFPNKNRLKKRKPIVIRLTTATSMSIAAAIVLFLIFGPQEQEMAPQIAENTTLPAQVEEGTEEVPKEKTPQQAATATIKVIKNSKSPVPVSNFKKKQPDQKTNTDSQQNQNNKRQRIASINLKNAAIQEVNTQYDKLVPQALSPVSINRSSLSLAEQARYEYSRATKIAEEEDVLIWTLASNGIKELNRLTGSEMKLLASKDQEGDISGIQFNSRFLQLSTPIERDRE